MKMYSVALLMITIALGPVATDVHADFLLVENGQPAATIVVADAASAQARAAAETLQHFLARISGAQLAILPERESVDGRRILVGHSESVAALDITVPAGVTYQMNEEGFVTKTVGRDLVLAGNEDWHYKGTLFAVYDLLDELGCRWFFPGDFGEVLPALKTIQVPERDRTERPDFRFRSIHISGGMPYSDEDRALYGPWCDRNRIVQLHMSLPSDGSVSRLAPEAQYFESHPHIYALDQEGNRQPEMLCMSEEDTVTIAVATITRYFRDNPEAYTFGFAPPDGFPLCYCDRCQSWFPGFMGKGYGDPSISEVWFNFADRVAREVYKEFPEKWIMTNGYNSRVRPPETIGELSPNLGIQSACLPACALHRIGDPTCFPRINYQQLIDRWVKRLDPVFIYDYEPGMSLANLPYPNLHNLRHDLPYFKDRGVWGFWTEGSNSWMVTQLNYYVRGRLMWDVTEDVDALVRDFCEKFFVAAADPMERYIWLLEEAVEKTHLHETWGRLMRWEEVLTPAILASLDALIAEAETKAQSEETKQRLHIYRLTHDHMKAYVAMENAARDGDFARAADWGRKMLALRDEAESIKTGLLPNTPDFRRTFRTSAEWHVDLYQSIADKMNGTDGDLVALLPRTWHFKKDPEDIGAIFQWYNDTLDSTWESIDSTIYWEAQGHQDEKGWGYWGKAWYQTEVDLPANATDRPLWLTIGAAYNTGVWVWVNGRMLRFETTGRKRTNLQDERLPFHIDITEVARPGATNRIAVLIDTPTPGRNPRGGLHRRSFIWQAPGA